MAIRIRRFIEEREFWENLGGPEVDVLPLLFADTQRDWIAQTIDQEVAKLTAGSELSIKSIGVSHCFDDWVLAAPFGRVSLLAKRYAEIARRKLYFTNLALREEEFIGQFPQTVTWFPDLEESDIANSFVTLCESMISAFGRLPALGVLTAENAATLSWVLAKQLFPRPDDSSDATTLVGMEPRLAVCSLLQIGKEQTVSEVVDGINEAGGTLLINGHSRPHCGILYVSDGPVGICGLSPNGLGRCVDNSSCYFGEAPRAVLEDLRARRVYFNGCTTGGVGTLRRDFLPRAAMVSHAALRGGAREFIGNVRSGHYDETDIEWFLAGSALGYKPAQCIEIIESARNTTGREVIRSAIYFGDPTNTAWPVKGVAVGEVIVGDDEVKIFWPRSDRVLVARVSKTMWADLAESDQVHVSTSLPTPPRVSIIKDPFREATLVLAVPHNGTDASSNIEVVFRTLDKACDRSIGMVLARAIENIHWIESLPAFATRLSSASNILEEELVKLRRAAASRSDLMLVPELLVWARDREDKTARSFDETIIDGALSRSQEYWNWQMEYADRVTAKPQKSPLTCPSCEAFANGIGYVDLVNPRIKRELKVCAYCGIVADLPIWDLAVRIVPDALIYSAGRVAGRVEVTNNGQTPDSLVLGAAVERAGMIMPQSVAKGEMRVAPGETSFFEFELIPKKALSDLMQTRVYVASRGEFGLVNINLLYGRV